MQPRPSVADYAQRLQQFWTDQEPLFEKRLANPLLRSIAFAEIRSEENRQVPLKSQTTLELALHKAAAAAETFSKAERSNFAGKGGRAKTQDEFQSWLDSLLPGRPRITTAEVIEQAGAEMGTPGSIITDVTDEKISFECRDGKIRDVGLSAVKHRLSRAKKKYRLQSL